MVSGDPPPQLLILVEMEPQDAKQQLVELD